MRSGALPMRAQVRHDHPEPPRGDLGGMTEADPVGLGVGKEAMEEHHRPALAQLVPDELRAVGRCEAVANRGASRWLRSSGRQAAYTPRFDIPAGLRC